MTTIAPPPAEPLPAARPSRSWPRRIARVILFALCGVVILGMTGWMALAVCFTDLQTGPPRKILAAIVAIAALSVAAFVRPRRRGLILFLLMFAGMLGWFFSIRPSHDRDWSTEVAVLPHARMEGDLVHLHNIRNFDYRSETDFTPAYYDRTLDLSRIKSVDLLLSYWSGRAIAHAMLSFGFEDGQYVAISIETRKEKGELYSAVEGFFRQYELIYVVADERDLIRLRTHHRNEEVYLYRTRATPEKARAVFLDYLRVVNALHDRPHFYNALTENCMTSAFAHMRSAPPYPPFTLGVLMSGYSAEYGYASGGLDHSVPFAELERRSHINDLAKMVDPDSDFSMRIRARVTNPQAPSTTGP